MMIVRSDSWKGVLGDDMAVMGRAFDAKNHITANANNTHGESYQQPATDLRRRGFHELYIKEGVGGD